MQNLVQHDQKLGDVVNHKSITECTQHCVDVKAIQDTTSGKAESLLAYQVRKVLGHGHQLMMLRRSLFRGD